MHADVATHSRGRFPHDGEDIARVAPELSDRVSHLESWDEVKLLTVRVDRLTRWHAPQRPTSRS